MMQSAAAAYIRQVCSLGLGPKAIMPELFRAIHDLIPSHLNVFLGADRNGELADIYSEYPDFLRLGALFIAEFADGAAGLPSFADSLRTRPHVEANEAVFPGPEFFASDYYNLIFRPQGIHFPLQAAVSDRSGRALGALLIYRGPNDPRYSLEEMRLMASFLPHVAHGMQSRPDLSVASVESEDRGLLIVQPPATVLHVSAQARNLAHFALDRIPDVSGERAVDAALAPMLQRLCANLKDTFTGVPAPPPTISLRSPWGLFMLRAYWLESLQPQENGLVGVTIERYEPLPLQLL